MIIHISNKRLQYTREIYLTNINSLQCHATLSQSIIFSLICFISHVKNINKKTYQKNIVLDPVGKDYMSGEKCIFHVAILYFSPKKE